MLNQISFHRPPEELILNPFGPEGVTALRAPEFIWRPRTGGTIAGFAASAFPEMNERIEAHLTATQRHRTFKQVIEFNAIPVVLKDVWFKKSFVTTQDRCLVSGASGMRLLNHYCWKNETSNFDPDAALVAYFHQCQSQAANAEIKVAAQRPPQDTAFAIECRNTFNFYHFLTESLCQLTLVAEADVQGPVYFHYPNADAKTRHFTMAFIQALFPELAVRVVFQRAPFHHALAIVPYNFGTSVYQLPAAQVAELDAMAPSNLIWKGRDATRSSHGALAMNAVDSSLYALRQRALSAIKGMDFSHLPRRFWVGRQKGHARAREMKGENEIFEMLGMFGFEHIAFETLSPLEQIGIMANAEVMISYHGAGFANMLFANEKMTVIELGTLQTATTRWGDFWRLANASQCRYVSFFADYHSPTPLVDPEFATDGIVPVFLSPAGLAQVMTFVVSLLGQPPDLHRIEDLRRVAQQLQRVLAFAQARAVIEKNAQLASTDLDTNLTLADCCEALSAREEQLSALYLAYRANPKRWQTLVSVIWTARHLDDLDTVHAALRVFSTSFPAEFAHFSKDRPWIKAQMQAMIV